MPRKKSSLHIIIIAKIAIFAIAKINLNNQPQRISDLTNSVVKYDIDIN